MATPRNLLAADSMFSSSVMNAVFILVLTWVLTESVGAAYSDESLSNKNDQPSAKIHALNSYDHDADASRVVNDITNYQLSTRTRSTSECWMESITTINRRAIKADNNAGFYHQNLAHSSGSSYCASMTNNQQKVLALELTNCQLMEANRPLYDDEMEILSDEQRPCLVGRGGIESYNASSCLPLLSDYALSLYHQILMDTQDVCTRLTEESMLLQKEEAVEMLVYTSSVVSQQMQNIMEGTAAAMEKAQNEQSSMMRELRERQKEEQSSMMRALREQQMESDRLYKAREETSNLAIDNMANQTASFFQEHAEKMKTQQIASEMAFRTRENEAALAVQKMKEETTTLIAEHVDKIKEQERHLERMQEMISSASSQIQPLSAIDSYVRLATGGFTILKALFNFFLSANIAWMVTSLPLLNRGRRYLFAIFALGFLAEFAFVWFADHDLIVDSGMDDMDIDARYWTRASAIVAILLSLVISCLSPPKKDDSSVKIDALLKSQMEIVSKLSAAAPPETREEISEIPPRTAPKADTIKAVAFSEEQGKSTTRTKPGEPFLSSNRNIKPRGRRSRSHYQSSLTELARPVVTPAKSRVEDKLTVLVAAPRSSPENQLTYYANRCDIAAKGEEISNRMELDCLAAFQRSAASKASSGEDTYGSSSDESASIDCSSRKRDKKRKVSEVYASSSDESSFFSADSQELHTLAKPSDSSPSRELEKKKRKLAKTEVHLANGE